METKEHTCDAGLDKFFSKLSDLKKHIKKKADETQNADLIEIYDRLHELFKVEGK
jgi:hypothetical protein